MDSEDRNERTVDPARREAPHATHPNPAAERRSVFVRRGLTLSVLTICWNMAEGSIAIVAGLFSGSVALLGFGVDSFIETASAVIVGWRFAYEMNPRPGKNPERVEKIASVSAGILLLALAAYLVIDALLRLTGTGTEPRVSRVGIALTMVSLLVMPGLAWAKLRTAKAAKSAALRADAYETVTCAWLSLTTLAGLGLNAIFGWWWADPAAALVLVPLIVREGLEGLRAEHEGDGEGR